MKIPVSIRKSIDQQQQVGTTKIQIWPKKKQQQQLFNHVRISKKQQPCKAIGGLN